MLYFLIKISAFSLFYVINIIIVNCNNVMKIQGFLLIPVSCSAFIKEVRVKLFHSAEWLVEIAIINVLEYIVFPFSWGFHHTFQYILFEFTVLEASSMNKTRWLNILWFSITVRALLLSAFSSSESDLLNYDQKSWNGKI